MLISFITDSEINICKLNKISDWVRHISSAVIMNSELIIFEDYFVHVFDWFFCTVCFKIYEINCYNLIFPHVTFVFKKHLQQIVPCTNTLKIIVVKKTGLRRIQKENKYFNS